MGYISAVKIAIIERAKSFPHPDEALTMAEKYDCLTLYNYYCTNGCAIGKKFVSEVKSKHN